MQQECIVEHISRVHSVFERTICCGFTGFTKGVVLLLNYDYVIVSLNLVIKINKINKLK